MRAKQGCGLHPAPGHTAGTPGDRGQLRGEADLLSAAVFFKRRLLPSPNDLGHQASANGLTVCGCVGWGRGGKEDGAPRACCRALESCLGFFGFFVFNHIMRGKKKHLKTHI